MRRRFSQQNKFDINDYLTIEALEDGLTASIFIPNDHKVYYCIDGDQNWMRIQSREETIPIDTGHTISFKANGYDVLSYIGGSFGRFSISKKCNLYGNCMSLMHGGDTSKKGFVFNGLYACTFNLLFKDCTTIISVSSSFLPETELISTCYYEMFSGCSSLINAPELPATVLSEYCYSGMFERCYSLVKAPRLPAITLAEYCYDNMFCNCTNLNYIEMLATDVSAENCLYDWVRGVSPTGTFIKNPDAEWDVRGNSGVPDGWTIKFDGIEEEPLFPITLTIGDNGEKGRELYEYILAQKEETGKSDYFLEPGNVFIEEENCTLIYIDSLMVEYYQRIMLLTEEHNSYGFDCYYLYDNGLLELYLE